MGIEPKPPDFSSSNFKLLPRVVSLRVIHV